MLILVHAIFDGSHDAWLSREFDEVTSKPSLKRIIQFEPHPVLMNDGFLFRSVYSDIFLE